MKKIFVTILAFLTSGTLISLPMQNPADASILRDSILWSGDYGDFLEPCNPFSFWCNTFNIRVGFYGDYVFNRHTKVSSFPKDRIEKTELFTNAGLIVVNFRDKYDIFTTFGVSNLNFKTNAASFGGANGSDLFLETDTEFSLSVGGRATIWEWGHSAIGIEGQYFITKPELQLVQYQGATSAYPTDLDTKYQEWQFGIGFVQRIRNFEPYAGIKWSRVRVDFDKGDPFGIGALSAVILRDLKNAKRIGYVVGVTVVNVEKAAITAEVRFADEKAFHINGQVKF